MDQKLITPTNVGVPTSVANPRRASWRAFLVSLVGALVTLNVALPIVVQFLKDNVAQATQVLGPAYSSILWSVNLAAVAIGLLAKLASLLLNHPVVNAWVTRHLPWLAPIKPGSAGPSAP